MKNDLTPIKIGDTVNLDGGDHRWTLSNVEVDEHGRSIATITLDTPPLGVGSVTRRVDAVRVTRADR